MTPVKPTRDSTAMHADGRRVSMTFLQWLYLVAFLCLVTLLYLLRYWTDPNLPGRSAQFPRGWWGWFDQGQYYRSLVALYQYNYNPVEHHYPIGYPLIGSLFYGLMPQHPFLIPDICFCLLICIGFIDICRRMVSFRIALILCFLGVVWCTTVLSDLIYPWTNIPAAAALMILCCLALAPERDRRRGVITGICAGIVFAVRPGDVVYAWPAVAALWLGCRSWRGAWDRFRWFVTGAAPVVAVTLYYSITIHGQLLSKSYLAANGDTIGLGFSSWGMKLYTFCVDGFAIFGEPKTLFTVFPLLFLVLPGVAVFLKKLQWQALAVIATQLGAVLYFLAFNDYWISNTFTFHEIRYWVWLVPFIGLYAYLTLTAAWRALGWVTCSLLILVPLALLSIVHMEIHPVFTMAVPVAQGGSGNGQNATCSSDSQAQCTISLAVDHNVTFDIVKLQTPRVPTLLYSQMWVDDRLSRSFHSFYFATAGDGQPLLLFYHRQHGQSLRLQIPPPYGAGASVTAVRFYRREWTLSFRSPLRNYHPDAAERL